MTNIFKKHFVKPITILLLMINSTLALAQISIKDGYIREMPPGQKVSAAFMQLTNNTSDPMVLIGGFSELTSAIEVHQHKHVNGVMQMSKLNELVIQPNETVVLKPGGLHIMLMGLKQRLVKGSSFSFQLQFADGRQQTLTLPVKSLINP